MSDYQQQGMFDDIPEEANAPASPRTGIDVVRLRFESAETMSWQELFEGFDSIHAITYSSGIGFVSKLLNMFETAEVIFGCESVLQFNMQEIIALQAGVLDKLRKGFSNTQEKLLSRVKDGSVHLYVAHAQLSHEKLYLLSARDGRRRVITGSANMSQIAFSGIQRENVCFMDGVEAYEWYRGVFEDLKNGSSDEIGDQAFRCGNAEDDLDKLPISQTVKVKKALVIDPDKEKREEIQFILDIAAHAKRLEPLVNSSVTKTGKIQITPDYVTTVRRRVIENKNIERELRSEYPSLIIDVLQERVTLNGQEINLSPASEEIQRDVRLFLKYMEGFSAFHGEYLSMQYRYFEFANWFFCSPFMAIMRDTAARYDQNQLPYPVFGLLYGQSKAGKTTFLETLLKMMIGQKPKVAAQDFTRSTINALKYQVQGVPIIVDDMVNTRFNQHAIETIKTDDFGIKEHLTNYSAVVISANADVKAVAQEVIRRTVVCRVEAGLTNTEVMKSNTVRKIQHEIGTAFYREYLRRMLDVLPGMLDALKSEDDNAGSPDIMKVSSEVIVDIIRTYAPLPEYIRPLTLDDYFSENVTGKKAVQMIQDAWKTNRKSFSVRKKSNELRYNAGTPYDAERIMKELPETLEAHKAREILIMKLDAAQIFFGIPFQRNRLPWNRR